MDHLKNFLHNYRIVIFFSIAFLLKNAFLLLDINFSFLSVLYFFTSIAFGMLIFAPGLFLKEKPRVLYSIIVSVITSLILFGDLVYFRYYSSIPSFSSLVLVPQLSGVTESVFTLIKFRDILLFVDILMIPFLWSYFKERPDKDHHYLLKFAFISVAAVIFLTIGIIDFKNSIPRFLNSVYESKLVAQRYGVFGSHFFDGVRTFARPERSLTTEEEQETVKWLAENVVEKEVANEKTGVAKGKNVILIQMESFQEFLIGKKLEGQEITPNLNKFAKKSYQFTNNNFVIGLGSTSDADITVNTSTYPLSDAATAVRFNKDDFTSLPNELSKSQVGSIAYHGFFRDFWSRGKTFESLGFEKFYAADNYRKGKIIGMGLSDKDFLTETVEKMKNEKSPSLHYLITLSSHHPFSINDEDKVITLSKERYNEEAYRYYNLAAYTDAALGNFFERLKNEGLYEDSVIVLYGDHAANVGEMANEKTINSIGLDVRKQKDYLEFIKVPLIIKLPGQERGYRSNRLTSNVDIMPTTLNLLGLKTTAPLFGTDVFGNKESFFASMALQVRSFATNGQLYFWDDGGQGSCTNSKGEGVEAEKCSFLRVKKEAYLSNSEKLLKNNLFKKLEEYVLSRNIAKNELK